VNRPLVSLSPPASRHRRPRARAHGLAAFAAFRCSPSRVHARV